jgi:hypothetical protein
MHTGRRICPHLIIEPKREAFPRAVHGSVLRRESSDIATCGWTDVLPNFAGR